MHILFSSLKVTLCVVLLSLLLPEGSAFGPSLAQAQSSSVPVFGGTPERPRMLIIFDTSRSMRFTPDDATEYPNMDYEPPGVGSITRICQGADEGNTLTLSCPAGQTISAIEYAYYGRETVSRLRCGMGTTRPTDNIASCDVGTSARQEGVPRGWIDFNRYAQRQCVGQQTCKFTVGNTTLDANAHVARNPCIGSPVGKYAVASAICGDDPCPPGAGSKFCLGKRALYSVVENTESLIEYAVAGYYQQLWERGSLESPANYQTKCKYDVIAADAGVWWNIEYDRSQQIPLRNVEDFTNHSGLTSASMPNAGTSYTFMCAPETWTNATGALTGVAPDGKPGDGRMGGTTNQTVPVGLNGVCKTGANVALRQCAVKWDWVGNAQTTGGAIWNGKYFQHPGSVACRRIRPIRDDGSVDNASIQGACAPSLPEMAGSTEVRFSHVVSTVTHSQDIPAREFSSNDCNAAPAAYIDRVYQVNRLPSSREVSPHCSDKRPCTYFRYPPGDHNNYSTGGTVFYQDHGTASRAVPVTINGLTFNTGPQVSTETTSLLPGIFGSGNTTCPQTATITDSWNGCTPQTPCDISLQSQIVQNVSCPPSASWRFDPATNECVAEVTAHSDRLSGSLDGTPFTLYPGVTWNRYTLTKPLTADCPNLNQADFTIDTPNYHGISLPSCGVGTAPNRPHECRAQFVSQTRSADLGRTVCRYNIMTVTYKATTPVITRPVCIYNRTRYYYERLEASCRYVMYTYEFHRKRYAYNFKYNEGDLLGSFEVGPLQYRRTAAAPYCSNGNIAGGGGNAGSVASHTDGNGFKVPSGPACKAELRPGESGCPRTALRCKLRWGTPGNERFKNFIGSTSKTSNSQPYTSWPAFGCPAGDPHANNGTAPNLTGGYAAIYADWCQTTSGLPYKPASWEPTVVMGDYYEHTTSNAVTNRGAWRDIYTYNGQSNPFNHSGRSIDRFYRLSEANAVGARTRVSGILPNKTQGLSIIAPTSGQPTWEYGLSAFRWGATGDPKALLRRYDATNNPNGLRMPDLGDMTPLAGALLNAHAYIRWVRTHSTAVGGDSSAACRKYSVLLITDGVEEPAPALTGTNPVNTVGAMRNNNIDVYIVGFGNVSSTATGASLLNSMAVAAGTATDTGTAYDASDYTALLTALNDIVGRQLSGFYTRSKPTFTSSGNRIYTAYFSHTSTNPNEYKGYLDAYSLATGVLVSNQPVWQLHERLNAMAAQSRDIYARPAAAQNASLVPELTNCSTPFDAFTKTIARSNVCNGGYRGLANEGVFWVRNDYTGTKVGRFTDGTVKQSRLTSIVHSQPVPVGAPRFSHVWATANLGANAEGTNFRGAAFYDAYRAFKVAATYRNASGNTFNVSRRETRVYVQSNGGLLHAVRENEHENDPVTAAASWLGEEAWGFSPLRMLRRWRELREGSKWGLDGAMGVSDICFGKADCEKATGYGWRTVLVGTAGRGGNYMYSLDVTDPTEPVWLWDFNPGSGAAGGRDMNMGETVSGPVIGRVRVRNDSYKWGVFVGGGFSTVGTSGSNDCDAATWDNLNRNQRPIGNFFYVLDADPAKRNTRNYHAAPLNDARTPARTSRKMHQAKYCISAVNEVRFWDTSGATPRWKRTHPKNNVPIRPRIVFPGNGSRAQTVYFGDTNGKLLRMDVTSHRVRDWAPAVWFNPFARATQCTLNIAALPDASTASVTLSLPLSAPLASEGLPEFWTRPLVAVNPANGRMVVYVGTGNSRVPERQNVQNYFFAIQDNAGITGATCTAEAQWAVYLDKATGEKVISEPAIVGTNIIVPVYVPPGGAGCGLTGFSKLYCFRREDGNPRFCLTDTSASPLDPNVQQVGAQKRARFVKAGDGIVSDLTTVGNTLLFNTSSDTVPKQIRVEGNAAGFRLRSWRRIR